LLFTFIFHERTSSTHLFYGEEFYDGFGDERREEGYKEKMDWELGGIRRL
jgi:hypothetical protein